MSALARLIREPLVLLAADGVVLDMNEPARRLFGDREPPGRRLFTDAAQLRGLLTLASGMGQPVLGALDAQLADGAVASLRVDALALRDGSAAFAIQVRDQPSEPFAALTERVRELNAEIALRRKSQAGLEDALARNNILYRELQHRVKNQLQMMLSLVSRANRDADGPTQRVLDGLRSQLAALFDAQRLMYAQDGEDGVWADEMLESIANTARSLSGSRGEVRLETDRVLLRSDVAFPVALITNELLINALRHGVAASSNTVTVTLRGRGGEARLEVRDEGPDITLEAAGPSASALRLVRGLCRQIGGAFTPAGENGVAAEVRFPLERARDAAA